LIGFYYDEQRGLRMKYQTKYDSLQIWHLHKLFADEAFSKWVVNEIVSGERDLSPDEIELRDQALRNAEVERAFLRSLWSAREARLHNPKETSAHLDKAMKEIELYYIAPGIIKYKIKKKK